MTSKNKVGTLYPNSKQENTRDYQIQLLAEYNALRAEAIHRMGARHQIVALSVAVLGAILAFGKQPNTLIGYPILGFFLALGWAHNDFRIGEIGEYIRIHIEKKLPGLNWEKHFFDIKKKNKPIRYILRATILSAGGIIVGTQILAVVIPFCNQTRPSLAWVPVDATAITLTAIVLHWRKMLYWKRERTNKVERTVLFIPNSELHKHFHKNKRRDVKVVTPAVLTEELAEKLKKRGKKPKKEVPLEGIQWTHSSANKPNYICESIDFAMKSWMHRGIGPVAISFATDESVETFHHHKKHWEIYFSDHKLSAEYKLPGTKMIETKTMDDGGTILFAPGVSHRIKIHGLTIVLEMPGIKGDREVENSNGSLVDNRNTQMKARNSKKGS